MSKNSRKKKEDENVKKKRGTEFWSISTKIHANPNNKRKVTSSVIQPFSFHFFFLSHAFPVGQVIRLWDMLHFIDNFRIYFTIYVRSSCYILYIIIYYYFILSNLDFMDFDYWKCFWIFQLLSVLFFYI